MREYPLRKRNRSRTAWKGRAVRRFITVNREALKSNRDKASQLPVLRIEDEEGGDLSATHVDILGPSQVVYRPSSPRPKGAEVWVETEADVLASVPQRDDSRPAAAGPPSVLSRLLEAGLLDRARTQLSQNLVSAPTDPELLRRLGDVLRQLGCREESGQIYERLSQACPGDGVARRLSQILRGNPPPKKELSWPVVYSTHPDWLNPERLQELRNFTVSRQSDFDLARCYTSSRDTAPLGAWFLPLLQEQLTRIQSEMGFAPVALAVEGCKITRFGKGTSIGPHVDRGPGWRRRVFGFVYSFCFPPPRFQGGGLAIYDWRQDTRSRADTCTTILPRDNELLILPADCWHEVLPLRAPDDAWESAHFTVNGWISLARES